MRGDTVVNEQRGGLVPADGYGVAGLDGVRPGIRRCPLLAGGQCRVVRKLDDDLDLVSQVELREDLAPRRIRAGTGVTSADGDSLGTQPDTDPCAPLGAAGSA